MFTINARVSPARSRVFWRRAAPEGGEIVDYTAPVLYTVKEACAVLRVSNWKLYQLIRSQQLASVRIGKRRLVPRDAVDALIARLRGEEPW
ncbi:MAG TPA: helix-turn-helix domain-containing protein [Amycolatopsis sp.]|uniref:helix-turn-helix domain-containing protein n=1 Tax=Amycolatopsis sp. TaxID=37632 RepID=UPI002B4832F9|nr:helix-turn-helix domain-containing protein [Amycolatopsis sp.]HKS46191.1 helix-turn-helix domain-containing protein [Amycolatopsis sp.]